MRNQQQGVRYTKSRQAEHTKDYKIDKVKEKKKLFS